MGNGQEPLPITPINFEHYISMLRQFKQQFNKKVKGGTSWRGSQ